MTWRDKLPTVRGKLLRDEPLAPFTWFRVGGTAEALFIPADAEDLADFLKALDEAVPVTVLGVGSNVIVRDGGVEGVVIRLAGRPWAQVTTDGDAITAGTGVLDSMVAKASAKAGIAGLEFYAGIPGTVGGALTMNAGCYGAETKDVLVSAWGLNRKGERVDYALADFGYTYRHSEAPADIIWVEAVYRGTPDEPARRITVPLNVATYIVGDDAKDQERLTEIQSHLRKQFQQAVAEGLAAVGFEFSETTGTYLMAAPIHGELGKSGK